MAADNFYNQGFYASRDGRELYYLSGDGLNAMTRLLTELDSSGTFASSVSELRTFIPPQSGRGALCVVQTTHSIYAWAASSTAQDNGGSVIRPASFDLTVPGRWLLLLPGGILTLPQFGCVGDGVTLDTVQFKAALGIGFPVTGLGLSYAIEGLGTVPNGFKGLMHTKLIQRAPYTANCRTLFIRAQSGFFLYKVTVDAGSNWSGGTMADYAGIWIDDVDGEATDITLEDVTVLNMGPGNGLFLSGIERLKLDNVWARECYHDVGASDDVLNGIAINNCTKVQVNGGGAVNITGVSTRRWSRGYAITGCSDITWTGSIVDNADQCFDFTGSVGNYNFSLSELRAKNAGTFGLKFANSAHDGTVDGCTAEKCGRAGFEVSGKTELTNPDVRNITFTNCHSYDSGSNGLHVGNKYAFHIALGTVGSVGYPRGIRFVNCTADDRQAVPTMTNGFLNEVPAIEYPNAGYNKSDCNEAVDCVVRNATGAPFSGMHEPVSIIKGAGTDSVNNATWKSVDFSVDIADTSGLHSTTSNNNQHYVKRPGRVKVTSCTAWAANAAGVRKATSLVNGGGAAAYPDTVEPAHPTQMTYVYHTRTHTGCRSGDSIRVENWQDSGGALNIDRAQSWVMIEELGP